MPLQPANRHRLMIADHLSGDHGQHLALGRIDLARHDRAARFIGRQVELAETGPRSGAEQPDIVGDLGHGHRQRIQRAGQFDHRVMRRQLGEFIGSRGEFQAGNLGEFLGDMLAKIFRCIEAGADRRAALCQLVQPGQYGFDPVARGDQLRRIAGKFLSQSQRCGVLEMGATDLDDCLPLQRLFRQRVVQLFQRREQLDFERPGCRDVHRGGEAVVGRLAAVDMVIRMDRIFAAAGAVDRLVGDAGDHFIDVHVGLGPGAGLPDAQRELIVIFAGAHRIGGLFNRCGNFRFQAMDAVDPRRCLFDRSQGVDQPDRHAFLAGKGEVFNTALGLGAPIVIGGHFDLAQRIGFGARSAHFFLPKSTVTTLEPSSTGLTESVSPSFSAGSWRFKSPSTSST